MPQVYYLDNYCYEVNNLYLCVYKYDIFDNRYYKIDQCLINKNIPKKYQEILKDINDHNQDIIPQFQHIKISS